MTKLKLIVRYVYGFICIIGALATFSSSALTAFLFIITGLFIIPKSHNIILEKLNITLDPLKRYFIAFIFFTTSCFAASKIPDSKEPEKVVAKTEETTKKYLLESVEDLQNNFNSFCQTNDIDHHIDDIEIDNSSNKGIFTYELNSYIAILGVVDKENSHLESLIISSTPSKPEAIVDMINTFAILASSIDVTFENKQRKQLLDNLGLLKEIGNKNKPTRTTIINNIKYSVTFNKDSGWTFSISKNEK